MSEQQSKGKKNRKYDRNKKSPAMQRYNATNRRAINKARKIAKHERNIIKKIAKLVRRSQRMPTLKQQESLNV